MPSDDRRPIDPRPRGPIRQEGRPIFPRSCQVPAGAPPDDSPPRIAIYLGNMDRPAPGRREPLRVGRVVPGQLPGLDEAALQTEWEALINAAFSTWQNATKGWVTASEHPTITDCADSAISTFIQDDDERSEIRVFKIPNDTAIFSFPEMRSDPLKVCLNDTGVDACVTSFTGYLGDDTFRQSDREEARRLLEIKDRNGGWTNNEEDRFVNLLIRSTFEHTVRAGTILEGVDITFQGEAIENLKANRRLGIPTTRFGRCPQRTTGVDKDNPDYEYRGYELAVHETLHAFGLTGFRPTELLNPLRPPKLSYEGTHATVPDSVLNYDKNVQRYANLVTQPHTEPDCAPHPFDVMALFALYQNVGR